MLTGSSPFVSELEVLREILLTQDRKHLESLRGELESLRTQSESADRVVALIEPLLTGALAERARTNPEEFAEAIRPAVAAALQKQVHEQRESIIIALTPIIGSTIQRALAQALQTLARQVDSRMQQAFTFGRVWERARARVGGVDEGEAALREALPWRTELVFVIHSDSGLVMAEQSTDVGLQDSDLVAALLTAIRSFARESFQGEAGDALHEIKYGDQMILLEEGQYAYLAMVGRGIPPADIFHAMREVLANVHMNHLPLVRSYRGDPGSAEVLAPQLAKLIVTQEAGPARPPTAGLILLGLVLLALVCSCGWISYRAAPRALAMLAPTAVLYIVPPPATPTVTPTSTPSPTYTPSPTATPVNTATSSPTSTPTLSPTATPVDTATPTPTATATPVLGRMTGNVYVRRLPDPAVRPTRRVALSGNVVRIIERRPLWVHIAYPATGAPVFDGWVPARWVGNPP